MIAINSDTFAPLQNIDRSACHASVIGGALLLPEKFHLSWKANTGKRNQVVAHPTRLGVIYQGAGYHKA